MVPILTLAHPSGAEVRVDADGHAVLHGFASMTFQDGPKRFSMEGLFDYVDSLVTWIKAHTHQANQSNAPTNVPIQADSLNAPQADSCLSPATFKGPQGA